MLYVIFIFYQEISATTRNAFSQPAAPQPQPPLSSSNLIGNSPFVRSTLPNLAKRFGVRWLDTAFKPVRLTRNVPNCLYLSFISDPASFLRCALIFVPVFLCVLRAPQNIGKSFRIPLIPNDPASTPLIGNSPPMVNALPNLANSGSAAVSAGPAAAMSAHPTRSFNPPAPHSYWTLDLVSLDLPPPPGAPPHAICCKYPQISPKLPK